MVLIYTSQANNNAEHLLICLWAIWITFLKKCLFRSLPVFKIGLFGCLLLLLLLLSCRSSLYTQNIYSFLGICSTNIFSCSVGYIFILFISLAYIVAPFLSLGERDSGRWLGGTIDKSSGHFQIRSTLRSAFSWPAFGKLLSLLLDTRVLHSPTWIPKLLQRQFG